MLRDLLLGLSLLTCLLLGVVGFSSTADAQQFEHQLVRRVVVFPIKTDGAFDPVAEEAWWQAREELTKSRRFLVASKQFLVKTDVFQPRGELEPADSILLAKLLDSHALITLQLRERRLTLNAYDGSNGILLWKKGVGLHPSLTVQDQLATLTRRLINDFVASIPYQGFSIVDPLVGNAVYSEGGAQTSKVDLGIGTGAQIGDSVQWVRLSSTNNAPLFQGGARMMAYAEGKILRLEQGIATVEVTRATAVKDIKEFSLVRIPREADRLRQEYTINETARTTLTPELVGPEMSPMEQVARERQPLMATLSFVGSIAAFLLLAF